MAMDNLYLPYLATIEDIYEETPDTRSYKLVFKDPKVRDTFEFKTGQFGLYSAFGAGESTFCIASSPTRKGYIQCTFRNVGRVTSALADLTIGDTIGFRGPYGNWFPIEEWEGKNLVFIAGGIALPPVRSVIWNCLDQRERYKDITISSTGDYLKPDLLGSAIFFNRGDLYSLNAYQQTLTRLNNLGVFKYINVSFQQDETDSLSNLLDVTIDLIKAKMRPEFNQR